MHRTALRPIMIVVVTWLALRPEAWAGASPVETLSAVQQTKGVDAAEAWALRWLKTHEGEPEAAEVTRWLDEARWGRAQRANTPEAYQIYRAQQPSGAYVAAARQAEGAVRCPAVLAARNLRVARDLRRELPGTPCADALLVHEHALVWAEAEHDDVPAAWDALLVDYPQHPRRDEALFRRTASVDTEEAWATYLEVAPDGPFALEARAAAARAGCNAWLDADATPTLEGLAALRATYPSLPCEPALAEIEAVLTWTAAAAINTPEAWTSLLERFPAHPRAAAARDRRSALWWSEAQRLDTEAGYADLLARDPTSPHREAITAKLMEHAVARARTAGTAAAWRAFAERFPNHALAPEATRRAEVLERREALAAADTLALRLASEHAEDGSRWLDASSIPQPSQAPPQDAATEPQATDASPAPADRPAVSWPLPVGGATSATSLPAASATLTPTPDGGARLTLRLGEAGPRREVAFDAVRTDADGCGHDTGIVWTTLDGRLEVDLRTHPRCGGEDRAARLSAGPDGWRFEGMLLPGLQGP